MKQKFWMSLLVVLVLAGTTPEAKARNPDRVDFARSPAGPTLLTSQPAVLSDSGYESPPPAPGVAVPPVPMPQAMGAVPVLAPTAVGGPPIALAPGAGLYPCVKYKDRRKIAPCAVPMCIAVRDPCAPRHGGPCCENPKCVLVEVCVPPCGCPRITAKHDGTKVRYDYGKYAVNITSRHGIVVVNYDD